MHYTYRTKGVCSIEIAFDIENDIIKNIKFTGGCGGNTQGVARLAEGRTAREVADICRGIDCRMRGTSCPDQLAKAIDKAIGE